ncbi:MAG: hypothetical protein M1840_004902 [Geoglossum simile]|nr:MAG: hypothetical protein M1840_004902 [Geoglossum simile]
MSISQRQSGPVIQPGPRSSVWEEARDRYRKTLNPTQQKKFEEAFTNAASLTDVIAAVESAGQSASHKFSTRFKNALEPLQTLAPVFDVVSNINTTIGCSIWGPLKLVVQASSKYSDGLETILTVIETLTSNVRRYRVIEEMHDSPFIRDVLRNFYFDLIDFCARCVKYYSRPKIINGLRAAFKPFDAEAKDVISNMNRHASAVDSTATTMEMEKANLFRKQQIQKNLEDQERTIRLWLKSASFEDEQKLRQKERVNGTNDWFLQHPSFKNWTNLNLPADNPRLFWAYGKPGCGKSILASSVVLELHNLGFRPIYFFFNSESGTASSDPIGLVRAFFFQLLDIDPELINHLFPIYTKSSSGEASSFDTLWEIFRLWCSRRSEPIFCVIDALDEALDGCNHPDNFLAAIVSTLKSCGMVRICVTSRPNPRIAKHFSPNMDLDIDSYIGDQGNRTPFNDGIAAIGDGSFISQVAISERQVSSDITAYVTTKVKSSSKLKSWMAPPDINALCVRAEGMFLWARLMIDELQNTTTPNSLKEMLNKAPKGLNAIYHLIIQRLIKTLSEDQLHLCRKVLQWTTTAREPLTINQLAIASAIRDRTNRLDEGNIPFREDILTVCAPLVEILEDDTIRIVHLSVKEFLFESPTKDGQADFTFSKNSVNVNLSVALLTLLSFDEFCPTGPSRTLDDLADDGNDSLKARQMLQYSLSNWYLHCIDSGIVKEAQKLLHLALDYLTSDNSFLWMEYLACYEPVTNWIHIENQLLEWGTNFDVESSSSFRGVVHRLADRRLAHLKRNFGETRHDTLNAMADLAITYGNQGRWAEAEALDVEVLGGRRKGLGETHPDTLNARANLATTYGNQGRWAEAEALGMEALEGLKKGPGETHPYTLGAMANLAITYGNQGRWAEAEALEVEVLEGLKKGLGETHPDTLNARANLATTYGNQGRWAEAEALGVEVLEGRRKGLGETHPDTLNAMADLAVTYGNQGRWAEAEALGMEALEGLKKGPGETHPYTLETMANLAATFRAQGRTQQAHALEIEIKK